MESDLVTEPALLDPPGRSGRGERVARLLFWPLQLALIVIILVAYVFFTPLRVDGESMEPNLRNADRLLYTKSYEEPHRGDVVVFDAGEETLLKRVVAVEGDVVEIRDDVALINGAVETTPRMVRIEGTGRYVPAFSVPADTVYLLGDNRPISFDSRIFGPVPTERIRGKAMFVFAPINRMHVVR